MLDPCDPREFYRLTLQAEGIDPPDIDGELQKVAEAKGCPFPVVKLAQEYYEQLQRDGVPYESDYQRNNDAFKLAEAYFAHAAECHKLAEEKADRLLEKLAAAAEEWAKDADLEGFDGLELVRIAGLQAESALDHILNLQEVKEAVLRLFPEKEEKGEKEDDEKGEKGEKEDDEKGEKEDDDEKGEKEDDDEKGETEEAKEANGPQVPLANFVRNPGFGLDPSNLAHDDMMAAAGGLYHVGGRMANIPAAQAAVHFPGMFGATTDQQRAHIAGQLAKHVAENHDGVMNPEAVDSFVRGYRQMNAPGLGNWASRNKAPLAVAGTAAGLGALYMLRRRAVDRRRKEELEHLRQDALGDPNVQPA